MTTNKAAAKTDVSDDLRTEYDLNYAQSRRNRFAPRIKRWFVIARGFDDPDPVDKRWVTSPEDAARESAARRGEPSRELLVLQLGWPRGHLAEPGGPTPPGTQFNKFPLDESSTISDVLKQAKITIRDKWWVDDSLVATPVESQNPKDRSRPRRRVLD